MKAVSRAMKAVVLTNRTLTDLYCLLEVTAPGIAASARPGQFALIRPVPDATDPLLGRPLAVFDTDPEQGSVSFLYMKTGRGTRLLSTLKTGEKVFVNGPLGKHFDDSGGEPVVGVAGGTGVAGVHFLLKSVNSPSRPAMLYLGARTQNLLVPKEQLADGLDFACSTDDGSCGFHGNVVDGLRQAFEQGRLSGKEKFFVAGPTPMMKAAAMLARERNLWMQVSLEARMACGVGACRGCIVPAISPHPLYGFMHRAVCTDGPVFPAEEIAWDKL